MPEIDDKCEFTVKADDVQFNTKTNGDTITITRLNLSKEKAASFAWLVNHTGKLKFEVKLD